MITAEQIKELRARTGAGIVDTKRALQESEGDIEKAIVWLRQKGKATAAKKSQRAVGEGVVVSYIHGNYKVGVIVSLRCETDFVARNEKFKEVAHSIALHIAAMDPMVVKPEDISAEAIAAERAIAAQQARESGKPAAIQEKMIEGKLKRFAEERALLTQPFVKDPNLTINDLINNAIAELGENISVGGFARLTI